MANAMRFGSLAARAARLGKSLYPRPSRPSASSSYVPHLATYRPASQYAAAVEDSPTGRYSSYQWELAEDLTRGTSGFKVEFSNGPMAVDITLTNDSENLDAGRARPRHLKYIWLRDNCRCSHCVNQATMQRNFNIFDIPFDIVPTAVKTESEGLRITWNHENHESFYPWSFVKRHAISNSAYKRSKLYVPKPHERRQLWGSEISERPPTVDYEEVMNDSSNSGLAKLTDSIVRHGLVFVDNTPTGDATHTKKLLERIGPIRETHYGGFYDFVPDMAKADTAYTNIALTAHTDTTYFTDPAGLQAFHMLSHTGVDGSPATGGESLLVDGYNAAEIMRRQDPKKYKTLCRKAVPWHASGNEGVTITSDFSWPVIEERWSSDNVVHRIRWNQDDRGVLPLSSSGAGIDKWYDAAKMWDEILRRKTSEFWFQLKPGTTLIFDNYRVLHGRSAFTGLRRICGAYINRDDFISTWRNTNFSRQEAIAQVVGL